MNPHQSQFIIPNTYFDLINKPWNLYSSNLILCLHMLIIFKNLKHYFVLKSYVTS